MTIPADICDLYKQFNRCRDGLNSRQLALLIAWEAFIGDQPTDFDIVVRELPDIFNRLLELSKIEKGSL
jgi:hypothetical protein